MRWPPPAAPATGSGPTTTARRLAEPMRLGTNLARALAREPLPATLDRWGIILKPGRTRATDAGDWAGCLVLVERGILEVECRGGARRLFTAGDLLALGWLPLRALRNPEPGEVRLLALRRHVRRARCTS